MQKKKIIMALTLVTSFVTQVYATDAFDLGKVRVVGEDAQSAKIEAVKHQINFDMGDRATSMPELLPDVTPAEFRPITEKQTMNNFHRENKDELSVAAGLGTRDSSELIINGRGSRNDYIGDLIFRNEKRDGYNSSIDTSRTSLEAKLSSMSDGISNLSIDGEYTIDDYAIRSPKDQIANTTAGMENDIKRFGVSGNSTLANGSFFKGNISIDSISRDINIPLTNAFEKQSLFSISSNVSYLKKITDKIRGRAALEVKSDDFESDKKDTDLTKSVVELGAEYGISDKAIATFGLKNMNMKSKNRTAPYISLDYRFAKPWQIVLSYDEDLGNDSLERIFMPAHYVEGAEIKASHFKTYKASLNYLTSKNDTIGIDLFSQKETDAIEYIDVFNTGKSILESRINYVGDAKRKGATVHGSFEIENGFRINISGTLQSPEDNTDGHLLSYEPEKILDVGFNFKKNKLMLDFSRRAEYDREARVRGNAMGATTNSFKADDYSRSDLAIRYKFNDDFGSYIKIKDLYDEGKELRHNVQEEGRVTIAGIEAHF